MKMTIFTDGGARGNPGPAACAYVVYDDDGNIRQKCGKYLGTATNNEAEYWAVIEALGYIVSIKNSVSSIAFFLDSQLVVNQLNGKFKVKEARLRELLLKIKSIEGEVTPLSIGYVHVPREQNAAADALVNETLDNMAR